MSRNSKRRKGPVLATAALRSVDLDRLDEALDRIVLGAFRAVPPKVLYHYTKWSGAEGILTTKQFWFTAHHCTNDAAELKSADDAVVVVARRLQTSLRGAARELIDLLLGNYSRLKVSEMTPVFVACFSQARDSDAQWQAYGDEGRGLCLGIRILDEPMPENGGIGCSLFRVDYSEEAWRDKIAAGLDGVCSEISAVAGKHSPVPRRALQLGLNAMCRVAAHAAISAKQSQWSSEQEWRQVAVERRGSAVQKHERDVAGKTVRFLKVSLREPGKPLALDEVIIGPTQDFDAARSRLETLLADAGYPNEYAALPRITMSSAGGRVAV